MMRNKLEEYISLHVCVVCRAIRHKVEPVLSPTSQTLNLCGLQRLSAAYKIVKASSTLDVEMCVRLT